MMKENKNTLELNVCMKTKQIVSNLIKNMYFSKSKVTNTRTSAMIEVGEIIKLHTGWRSSSKK